MDLSLPGTPGKLGSRQIDLSWNTLSLYRLLIRRFANAKTEEQTREMIEYMSAVPGLVQEVSADRVAELKEDFLWLENLKTVLEGETLLMPGIYLHGFGLRRKGGLRRPK